MIRRAPLAVLSLGLAGALLVPAFSAHAAWKVLGVIKADKGLDRDEVVVKSGRAFRQIKLKADAADVEIQSLHVVYGNGEVDKIEVRSVLRAGSTTLPRDLRGERARDPQGDPLVQDVRPGEQEGDRHDLRERLTATATPPVRFR